MCVKHLCGATATLHVRPSADVAKTAFAPLILMLHTCMYFSLALTFAGSNAFQPRHISHVRGACASEPQPKQKCVPQTHVGSKDVLLRSKARIAWPQCGLLGHQRTQALESRKVLWRCLSNVARRAASRELSSTRSVLQRMQPC